MRITKNSLGRRTGRVLAAVAATIAIVAGGSSAASAAPRSPAPASASTEACWLNMDSGQTQCFEDQADLEAAIEEQTGTELVYPAEAPTASSSRSAEVALAATYVLAVFYDGYNYTFNSFTATTTESSLCNGWTYGYANLGSWFGGWEDKVSSFKTYGGCRAQLWEERNYVGSSYGPSTGAGSMGAMHNKASSIRIFS